jgi:DNA polymerase/3'-5' exonuclease PolX
MSENKKNNLSNDGITLNSLYGNKNKSPKNKSPKNKSPKNKSPKNNEDSNRITLNLLYKPTKKIIKNQDEDEEEIIILQSPTKKSPNKKIIKDENDEEEIIPIKSPIKKIIKDENDEEEIILIKSPTKKSPIKKIIKDENDEEEIIPIKSPTKKSPIKKIIKDENDEEEIIPIKSPDKKNVQPTSILKKSINPNEIIIPKERRNIIINLQNNKEHIFDKNKEIKNHIITILNKIAKLYAHKSKINKNDQADLGRSRAFYKAAENLNSYIGNYNYDHLHKAGIGGDPKSKKPSSTINEIVEIFNTNNSERLNKLMEEYGEDVFPNTEINQTKLESINLFKNILYIGDKKATELVNAGYKTMEDLKNDKKNLLSVNQKIFVKYTDQISLNIPNSTMKQIKDEIQDKFKCKDNILQPKKDEFTWIIAGSFRRKNPISKDIDLVVMNKSIDEILKLLNKIVFKIIKQGDYHASILAQFDNFDSYVKMDIISTDSDEWYYEILHWTGPADFVKLLQVQAHKMNYKILNEHGLFDNKDNFINVSNEEQIFELLNIKYIPPNERNSTIVELID